MRLPRVRTVVVAALAAGGALALAAVAWVPGRAEAQQPPPIVHGSPSWSPDGSRLVFHSNRAPRRGSPDGLDVFVARADGTGGMTNLTQGNPTGDAYPAWSPNGERIAFLRREPVGWVVWVIDPDGTQRHVAAGAVPGRLSWSPDSTRIAYLATTQRLRIGSAAGAPPIELPTRGGTRPAWSPDGTRIAYLGQLNGGGNDVYVVNADGTGERNVSNDGFFNEAVAWSPDGGRLVYTAAEAAGVRGLYTVGADGSGKARIFDGRDPDWAPSERIVLARDQPGPSRVLSVTGAGGDARPLLTGIASQLVWSPNAARIAFVSHVEGNESLAVMNADGSGVVTVASAATAGTRASVTEVNLPDRLVVSQVRFSPNRIRSLTAPVEVRVRVLDTRGRAVDGALVFLRSTPLVTTTPPEGRTAADGWVRFTIRPQPDLRMFFRPGYNLQFFVRARKPGEPLLAGVSTRRLVQVPLQP